MAGASAALSRRKLPGCSCFVELELELELKKELAGEPKVQWNQWVSRRLDENINVFRHLAPAAGSCDGALTAITSSGNK